MVAVITLAASVGVGVSLSAMRRTHSGALRRLVLVMLLAGSTILQMSSVALLSFGSRANYPSCGGAPGELSQFFNNISSSSLPVQNVPGPVSLSTDDSLDVTTMAAVTPTPPASETTTQRLTTTSSTSTVHETTLSHTLALIETTSEAKPSDISSIPPSYQNGSSFSPSSHSSGNMQEANVSSISSGSDDTPSPGTHDDAASTTEKQEEEPSEAPPEIEQTVAVPPDAVAPPNTTEELDEDVEYENPSKEDSDKVSNEEHVIKDGNKQHKDKHKINGKKHHGHRLLQPTKQLQENYDRISNNAFPNEYEDYYIDNEDTLENREKPRLGLIGSQDLQSQHMNVAQSFGNRNSYKAPGGTPQRPDVYGNKKEDSMWSRFSPAADKTKGYGGDPINILSLKQPALSYPPRIPAYGQSNSDNGERTFMSYNSRSQSLSAHPRKYDIHHPPYPDTRALGSEDYSEGFQYPLGRSNSDWRSQTGRHKRAVSRKKNSKAEVPPESKDHDTASDIDDHADSSDPIMTMSDQNLMGIKVGVTFLLVFGALLGSGVEAAVAQLWHCYAHGYDEGGVSQDILQRTVTHTFHLSVYANHNLWAKLTSGAWVLGAGVISIATCAVGVSIGAFGGLAGMHLALGACAVLMVLVIPVPYGSVDPPKTRRPLSLYLDDEVGLHFAPVHDNI